MPTQQPILRDQPTAWRGGDFALVFVGGLILGGPLALMALAFDWGTEATLVVSAVGQYLGHFLVLVLLARRRGGADSLGFSVAATDPLYVGIGLILQIILPILFLPLASLVDGGESGQVVTEQMAQLGGPLSRAVMGVVLVVLAPITEEVMFRGVLLRALTKAGRRAAMVWSALIFAGFHLFGLSGDVVRGAILTMPTFFVMGLILASVTMKRGRLGPAIFIHSGFNLLAMVVLLMPPELVEQLLQQ